jgi:hypothetical protein
VLTGSQRAVDRDALIVDHSHLVEPVHATWANDVTISEPMANAETLFMDKPPWRRAALDEAARSREP